MEYTPYSFLIDFAFASLFIFIAQLMRGKIKFLQNAYVPSSVIAGFLGLICGNQFLGFANLSSSADQYPYLLICVLFAGLFIGKKLTVGFKEVLKNVGDTFLVNTGAEIFGFGTACLIGGIIMLTVFNGNGFKEIALLMQSGFVGGHGYAAAIGGNLNNLLGRTDCVYIGQTFATIGLLSGVLGGIVAINYAIRKGYTSCIKEFKVLPKSFRTGIRDKEERNSIGDDSFNSMAIGTVTYHFSLIMLASGIGYAVYYAYKAIPAFKDIEVPMMCLTMLAGILVNFVINKIGYQEAVDKRIIDNIGNSVTDYLVFFGIATIKISVVLEFLGPIVVMSILGIITALFVVFFVGKRLYRKDWFEKSIFIYGYITGVVAIGVTLLRIVDPNNETTTLDDFGTAYSLQSIIEVFLVMFIPMLVVNIGIIPIGVILTIIATILFLTCYKIYGINKE